LSVKPPNLIYGVDDRPPFWASLSLGVQHLCLIAIGLLLPAILASEAGLTPSLAERLVSMSMVAGGVGAILQALPRGPVGSGFLCPPLCGPSFLAASIMAAKAGGLPLLFGMTTLSGITEVLLSRIMHRLRFLFPAEVTGLIVAMVGITVIRFAASNFLGISPGNTVPTPHNLIVALLTLACMVGLNVWSKGKLRMLCVIIGITVGYAIAWALDLVGATLTTHLTDLPLVYWPFAGHTGWSLDVSMIVAFVVATLCSVLKTVGDVTMCQKINDETWKRPDMGNVKKGVLANGLACLTAGLLGGMGQSTSSSNVGLSVGTGATSRVIGFYTGGLLLLLAFCPKIAAVFAHMPRPIIGAALVFSLSFMIAAGLQIILSRMLDARKIFVVGISFIFGLSVDILPHVYDAVPAWIHPVFASSLAAAAMSAVILNLILRIGIAQKASLSLALSRESARDIHEFMAKWGQTWGARKEVIDRLTAALTEIAESVTALGLAHGPMSVVVSFNELKIQANVSYPGQALDFPSKPPHPEDVLLDSNVLAALSGYLVRRYADKIKASTQGDQVRIQLELEH